MALINDSTVIIFAVILFYYFFLSYPFQPPSLWQMIRPKERYTTFIKVYLVRYLTAIPSILALSYAVSKVLPIPLIDCFIIIGSTIWLLPFDRALAKLKHGYRTANKRILGLSILITIISIGLWLFFGFKVFQVTLQKRTTILEIPIWALICTVIQLLAGCAVIALQNRARLTPISDFHYDTDEA